MTDLPSTDLAELRRRAGLTQEELAERAGLTARSIRNLERGQHRPRRRTLTRIRAALELDDVVGHLVVEFGPGSRHDLPVTVLRQIAERIREL